MTTDDYPVDMSNHVRDPKIFKKNEKYYMVLGARDVEGVGMILLYESTDLKNWTYKNRITTPQKFGYMWECRICLKWTDSYTSSAAHRE